jgi:hypothetical protein
MLELYGNDGLRALFPTLASIEETIEVLFQLNKLGSDAFALLRAIENRDGKLNRPEAKDRHVGAHLQVERYTCRLRLSSAPRSPFLATWSRSWLRN